MDWQRKFKEGRKLYFISTWTNCVHQSPAYNSFRLPQCPYHTENTSKENIRHKWPCNVFSTFILDNFIQIYALVLTWAWTMQFTVFRFANPWVLYNGYRTWFNTHIFSTWLLWSSFSIVQNLYRERNRNIVFKHCNIFYSRHTVLLENPRHLEMFYINYVGVFLIYFFSS